MILTKLLTKNYVRVTPEYSYMFDTLINLVKDEGTAIKVYKFSGGTMYLTYDQQSNSVIEANLPGIFYSEDMDYGNDASFMSAEDLVEDGWATDSEEADMFDIINTACINVEDLDEWFGTNNF